MKHEVLPKLGGIVFLIGIIFIVISWYHSYPIHLSSINDLTFFQFDLLLWPGMVLSLIGLFLTAFYSESKLLIATCSSILVLFLNVDVFFYSYISSSDSGAAAGMFQVFQKTGINSNIVPYFEFPTYFSLNDVIRQIVGVDEKGVALISFILYGALLGLFLYLFFVNIKKFFDKSLMPFLLITIFFVGTFSFLNYQWVPQTLALVFFLLLLTLSCYLFFNEQNVKWNFLIIFTFIPFVFSHAFLPVIFLSFFGILTIKKKVLIQIFIVIFSIYIIVTVFFASSYVPLYVHTFLQSITGFSKEYTTAISVSLREPESLLIQFISFLNGIKVPMIWILCGIGTSLLLIKKRIDFVLIAIGLAGGIYLAVGLFYSVLGLRAAQILFIFMSIGIMFFVSKWKKLILSFIIIILILAVFGPMRIEYNNTHFQVDEEANTCAFLANKIINVTHPNVAIGQVNFGYFTVIYSYIKNNYAFEFARRPGGQGFLDVFNESLKKNDFILYDTNLGKEIIRFDLTEEQFNTSLMRIKNNNKIFDSGSTFILIGIH